MKGKEGTRGEEGLGEKGGLNLVNRILEDNLGLVCDLHALTNWKSDIHIQMSNSVYTPTHTNMQGIICR